MTDSAALPLALSDLVADLREPGPAGGDGDVRAGVRRRPRGGERAVGAAGGGRPWPAPTPSSSAPGPGVVGTGSEYGFGGVEVAAVVDAAAHLGGRPIVAVRYSDADGRDRHRGVSHHTTTALALAGCRPLVAVPRGGATPGVGEVVEVDVPDDLDFGPTTSMGGARRRSRVLRWAAAAGVLAARLLG